MRVLRTLLLVAAAASAVACGGTEPQSPVVTSVVVTPATAQVEVGAEVTLSAEARDQQGNPMTGRAVSWRVADPAIAQVGMSSGVVVGLAAGTTTVTATLDGRTGSASIVVVPVPVAQVTIVAPPASIRVEQVVQLAAIALDRAGNGLTGRAIAWTSSAPEVATVAAGLVRAVAPGTAVITAESEGVRASVTIAVLPAAAAPAIGTISPAILIPGETATITGTDFDPEIAKNVVTIGGAPAQVASASTTQLVVHVPCTAGGDAAVRVVTSGVASAPVVRAVRVPRRTLAVGQALVLTSGAPSLCNELAPAGAGARYVVAVFSAATSANNLTDFELGGNLPPPGETAPRIAPLPALRRDESPPPREAMHDRAHIAWLERDRARYEELRARAARMPAARRTAVAAPLPSVGDLRDIYYTFSGGCGDTTRVVRGRAIRVGTRSIIWEDSANVLQSGDDAMLAGYYERLGRIFDEDQYEAIRATFGDPLRRDAETDGDGRIHMVFTQRVNGTGAAAFVTACDQRPRSISRGSNHGEFFYGMVPTVAGSNLASTASVDGWFNFMARTVVHEVKHIASHAARVANDAPTFEQSWLEEGTARHAEEVWVRSALHRVSWKGNTGYGTAASNGVFCDFHPEDATCNAADPLRRPGFGMRRQFNEIRDKLLQPWNWSIYGDGAGQSGSVFYQTVWSLVRYTVDRYASSDAAFFTALTNATSSGTANLSAVAGVPMDQLLGGWGLALYADDHPDLATPNADLQFPTWNLRAIYGGLNADPTWTSRWASPYPVQPVGLPSGAFSATQRGLRGGAHAYFELPGAPSAVQLLALRGLNGALPSPNLRLAIARIR